MELIYEKSIHADELSVPKSSSTVSEDDNSPTDSAVEKKLVRKCDLHVLPMISILYILAFVDRVNIGNARIQGLEADLHMKGNDYNIALFMFFIPYVLVEVPSNLLIKKIAPSTWLSFLMVCWGVITICQGVTQSFAGLVVCRVLLGFFEAGFVPGCVYLISMYYKRTEVQWRINLFFCASITSGAFGGLFGYACANLAGTGGYNGWRWIFIIEGLITVVAGALAKHFVVDWPETSSFLSNQERALLERRIREDTSDARMDRFDKKARSRACGDWKIYICSLMYFGVTNNGYSTSFFTPTILKELGWTSVRAQVLTIPIYVACIVVVLIVAYLSDRLHHRYSFTMLGVFIGTVGYVILLAQKSVSVSIRYFAVYLITIGGYITQPLIIGWLSNNMGGHYKRSVATAILVSVGNTSGFLSSNVFTSAQAPTYPVGFGVGLGMLWLTGVCCTIFVLGLWLENRKREQGGRDNRYNLEKDELENLGDDHPRFRFIY